MKNMPNYDKNYFGKIGHKIFCQRHQNFARFSKSGKNYAKLATLYLRAFNSALLYGVSQLTLVLNIHASRTFFK